MKIKHRNQLPEFLKHLGLKGVGVEVGVAEGFNAFNILDNWGGTLHLIDPWKILDTPGFSPHGEETDAKQEERYQRILRQAQKYGSRCKVVRATGEQAAPRYADGSLCVVYIDAVHTKEASADDIKTWWPKLHSGGVLAGHDYLSGIFQGQSYGVKDSVDAFAAANGLHVHVTSEADWPSWVIQKP